VVPPLTRADWQHAFDLYKQTPQYIEVAGPAGMTLSGFKFIFFWEWVHRLLGRVIGLVFFAGVAWFAVKRAIPNGYGWRLAALFLQLMLGAWVAGFRAGYVSNSWPLMGGRFVPEGIDWSRGMLFAITHDRFLIHFLHRWWAWVVVIVVTVFARKVRMVEGA